MSNRPVNDAQRKVLDWLAAGGASDPPTPEMKLSAAALKARGLVKVRRPGGKWRAELTEAGWHFVEHGDYPPKAVEQVPAPPARRRASSPKPTGPSSAAARATALPPTSGDDAERSLANEQGVDVPLRQVVRRPHPAVMEIRDRPGRLPKFVKRRCVLIVHSLVTEALARGWTVTPIVGTVHHDAWSVRSVRYDQQSLVLIDAGHAPIGLVFDEITKRRRHEDTPQEAAKRAKGQYVYTPSYDYLGTGRLRLHLTQGDSKMDKKFVDGARTTVEDQLSVILDAIEQATKLALHWAEQRRIREEEEAARRREAERIRKLRDEYEDWESRLHKRGDLWVRHRQLAAFLDEVAVDADDPAALFVEWARGLLSATDPRRGLPAGEPPQWAHEERAKWGRPEPKPKYGWR